jgi:single-stranded DNA-binding protein
MSEDNKKFRSSDRFEIHGAYVMVVGEPKEINKETTLCSVKVISQPGNERDSDCWVTVTGANKLGEKLYGLTKGDRIAFAGKPYFGAYIDKEGVARPTLEIKFPEYVHIERTNSVPTEENAPEPEEEDDTPVNKKDETPTKRGPGRPKKKLVFDEE